MNIFFKVHCHRADLCPAWSITLWNSTLIFLTNTSQALACASLNSFRSFLEARPWSNGSLALSNFSLCCLCFFLKSSGISLNFFLSSRTARTLSFCSVVCTCKVNNGFLNQLCSQKAPYFLPQQCCSLGYLHNVDIVIFTPCYFQPFTPTNHFAQS